MIGYRKVLRGKIHRAVVTHADVDYEGSITLSPELLNAAGLLEYEAVAVWNITQGTRFETYTIAGEPGSRDIAINGAAAHLVNIGDRIIVACFDYVEADEAVKRSPQVLLMNDDNTIKEVRPERPGPIRHSSQVRC